MYGSVCVCVFLNVCLCVGVCGDDFASCSLWFHEMHRDKDLTYLKAPPVLKGVNCCWSLNFSLSPFIPFLLTPSIPPSTSILINSVFIKRLNDEGLQTSLVPLEVKLIKFCVFQILDQFEKKLQPDVLLR